jgi:putative membrane protein
MPELDDKTNLALDRTRMAYERTMMAWIRTAVSLISFGFTIYKFFDLQNQQPRSGGIIGPRVFALGMIVTGLVALSAAAYQHNESLKTLRAAYGVVPKSTAALVAIFVAALGILAFGAVALNQ